MFKLISVMVLSTLGVVSFTALPLAYQPFPDTDRTTRQYAENRDVSLNIIFLMIAIETLKVVSGKESSHDFAEGKRVGLEDAIQALQVLAGVRSAELRVAAPVFYPEPETYSQPQTVHISSATPEATIHYTTDGSEPTQNSAVYDEPIVVSSTTTIKARAFKSGWMDSVITGGTYLYPGSELSNLSLVATTLLPSPAIEPNTEKVDYGATIRFGAIVWLDDRDAHGGGTIARKNVNLSFKAYLTDPVDDKSGEYDDVQELFVHPATPFGDGPEKIDGTPIPPIFLKNGVSTGGLGDWGYFGDNDAFAPHLWGVQGVGDYLRTQDLPADLDSDTVNAFQNDIIPALRDLMAQRNNWLHPTEAAMVHYEHTALGMTFAFFLYTHEIVAAKPGVWRAEFMVDALNLVNESTSKDNLRTWEFVVEDRGVLYEPSEFYGSGDELAEWPDTNLVCEPAPAESAPIRYRVQRIRVRHGGGETSGYKAFDTAGVSKQARRKTKIDEFWGPYATGKFSMDGADFTEYPKAEPNQVRYVFMMATGQDAKGKSTTTGQEKDSAKGSDAAKWVELLNPSLPAELARLHHQYGFKVPFNPNNTLIFMLPKHYYYLYQAPGYKSSYEKGLVAFIKERTGDFSHVEAIFMAGRSRGGALCLALANRLKDLRSTYSGLANTVIMPIGVDAYSDYNDAGAVGHGAVAANGDSFGSGKAYKGRKHNLMSIFGSDDKIFARINHGHYKKESNVFDCGSDCSRRKYQLGNDFGSRENVALCNGGELCHDEVDPYLNPSDLVSSDQVTQVAFTRKHYGFDADYHIINQGKNLEYFFKHALEIGWPDTGAAGCGACSTSQWCVRNWPNPETTSYYDNMNTVAMVGQAFSVDRAMKISHVSLKVTHDSGTNSYRVTIYADCGGQPCGAKLGESAWQAISTSAGAWTNFPIQGAPLLSNLDSAPFRYWLVFESQNSDAGGFFAHGAYDSARYLPDHGTLYKPHGIDWVPRMDREDMSFVIHECAN